MGDSVEVEKIHFGVLTVSDVFFVAKGDTSGQQIENVISKTYKNAVIKFKQVVPNDQSLIEKVLTPWSNECQVILTIGGTGFGHNDVTPEATKKVIEKDASTIVNAMLYKHLKNEKNLELYRLVCGIKSNCLIINLPGDAEIAIEWFEYIKNSLSYIVASLDIFDNDTEVVEKEVNNEAVLNQKVKNGKLDSVVKFEPFGTNVAPSTPAISLDDAKQIIYSEVAPVVTKEIVPLDLALNRVLAEDIFSNDNVPNHDVSLVNGYAMDSTFRRRDSYINSQNNYNNSQNNYNNSQRTYNNSQHTSNNSQHTYNNSQHTYNNSQHTSNNSQPTYNNSQHTYYIEHSESNDKNKDELKKDRAVPIKIGEMLPKGTDSVIQSINISVKQQTINNKVLDSFQIGSYSLPIKGQNIKPRGDYIKKDTKIFCKGEIFTHSHVSILVSTANYSIKVYRKPSIGVISFGDDLFQSSRGTINLLKKYDFNVTNYGTAINKPNDMKWALEKILKNNQFVLTHYNMVPNSVNLLKEVIVNDFDGIVHFDNLDMNPGPATFFSSLEYNGHVKYIFGLETKPTAAATACIQLVIPTLRKYSRHPKYEFPIINCVLDKSIPQTNDKRTQNYLMEVFLMQNDYHCQPVVSTIPDDVRGLLCANGILLTKGDLQHEANQSYPVIVF